MNEFVARRGLRIPTITNGVLGTDSTGLVIPLTPNVHYATPLRSDYDYNITGLRNSVNTVFTLSANFIVGSTRVFLNGLRLTPGINYDYVETAPNQITFTNPPDNGDLITVDYLTT